jgi:hypothetical protein
MNTKRAWTVLAVAASFLGLGGCGTGETDDRGEASEALTTLQSAVDTCVFGAPVIVETREETPGPVAPGISKVYFVTVRNTNTAACGPAQLFFTPDSFMFFRTEVQPTSVSGVGSGATAQFRLVVTSDPSVGVGSTSIGFTVIATGGNFVRGAVTYTVSLDNPTGCNRQRVALSFNANPPAVPPQTPVVYRVTARNVDNRECGPDTFFLSPFSLHFVTVTTTGPFVIPPQGSATFDLTITPSDLFGPGSVITEQFTVSGQRHLPPNLSADGTVFYRVR